MSSYLVDYPFGRVLIYIHKERELDEVVRRYPANHYVLVIPIRSQIKVFRLEAANEGLAALRTGKLDGAAVLTID